MESSQQKAFTGLWIPVEILLDKRLKPQDKILFAEIASFGSNGCYKRAEELQEICGVKSDAMQESAKRLRQLGYITEQRRFGRIFRLSNYGFGKLQNQTVTNFNPKNNFTIKRKAKTEQIVDQKVELDVVKNVKKSDEKSYQQDVCITKLKGGDSPCNNGKIANVRLGVKPRVHIEYTEEYTEDYIYNNNIYICKKNKIKYIHLNNEKFIIKKPIQNYKNNFNNHKHQNTYQNYNSNHSLSVHSENIVNHELVKRLAEMKKQLFSKSFPS